MFSLPVLNQLQDCEDPPLTPETLAELQITLGVRFPSDYAEFLLQFNGGEFRDWVRFDIPNPDESVRGALLRTFIGEPNDGIEEYGLVWWSDWLTNVISKDFLPIAHCNSRDAIVMKFSGRRSEFDGVWFFDSEGWYNAAPSVLLLADTFTEFLSMLSPGADDDEETETLPLFLEVERGNLTTIERYLARGGDTEVRNERGLTLLAAAVDHRWPGIVRLLLEHSADPHARDNEGRTPLFLAARRNIDSVKLLLAAGADPKARDIAGNSMLGSGWSYRADKILRAHGAED